MKQQGMYYLTLDAIRLMMFKPAKADFLFTLEKRKKDSILKIVPEDLQWKFVSTGRNYNHLQDAFTLIGVPDSVVEEIRSRRYFEAMVDDPIVSDQRRTYLETIRDGITSSMDTLAIDFINGFRKIEKENCYIWLFTPDRSSGDDYLGGIYMERPITLIEGGLGPKLNYKCNLCGHVESVTNDIPDMFYDPAAPGQPAYCNECAGKVGISLRHIGE